MAVNPIKGLPSQQASILILRVVGVWSCRGEFRSAVPPPGCGIGQDLVRFLSNAVLSASLLMRFRSWFLFFSFVFSVSLLILLASSSCAAFLSDISVPLMMSLAGGV